MSEAWGLSGPEGKGVAGDDHAAAAAQAVEAIVAGEDVNFQEQGWVQPQAYNYQPADAPTYDGNAVVYTWDGEHGEVGPEYTELEEMLFGPEEERKLTGVIDFSDPE